MLLNSDSHLDTEYLNCAHHDWAHFKTWSLSEALKWIQTYYYTISFYKIITVSIIPEYQW